MSARSKRAARAMAHLPESDPALAALALWCDVVDGDATTSSGDRISIGAEFDILPLREQIGVLGHHILHVALRHAPRQSAMAARMGDGFAQDRFNLAADAIVNSVLEAGGHALPRPAVTLPTLLRDVVGDVPDDGTSLTEWDVERLYTKLRERDGTGNGETDTYIRAKDFTPDLDPNSAPQDSDADAHWTGHLIRAGELGGSGRGIGSVLARIADLPRSDTPWDTLLRRLLTRAVSDLPRQSYRRPRGAWVAADADARRRGTPAPVFEPGQARNATRPRIAIGLDSSGSIAPPVLSVFAAEIAAIARRSGAELHLLCFDDEVYDISRLDLARGQTEAALTSAPLRRGGGTSFVEVVDKASALEPSIIVMLTDMDGPFGTAPSQRVIWATPAIHWQEPPFGQVISLAR